MSTQNTDIPLNRLKQQLTDDIGSWEVRHSGADRYRTVPIGEERPAAAWKLAWVVPTKGGSVTGHVLTVGPDNPEAPTTYLLRYAWDDFPTSPKDGPTEFFAETAQYTFDTATDAAAYAVQWMQTYPGGGPPPDHPMHQLPDPADVPPLDELVPTITPVQPDLDTTGILDDMDRDRCR